MQAMAVPPSAPDIPVQRGADFVEAAIGIVGIAQAQACGGVAQSAQTAHRVIAPAGVEALALDAGGRMPALPRAFSYRPTKLGGVPQLSKAVLLQQRQRAGQAMSSFLVDV